MDTMAQRYARLAPFMRWYGPDDDKPRPVIVFFHGCGGLRPHVTHYAEAAARTGIRALVVDSFGPRGWDRNFAVSLVCSGAVFQGYERAGDVLSVLWGLKQEGRISEVMLAGFSHGGWAIMDLMTDPLTRPGAVKIADPDAGLADAVRALFLVYPYINFPARSSSHNWVRKPETFAVLASKDHLTPIRHSRKVFMRLEEDGLPVETLELNATHAFDEEDNKGIVMRYDPVAVAASIAAMQGFIEQVFGAKVLL
ncbi:dienelactone hydrolase family protein [Asticcacaulis sp. EMRT-3]|uniref:dienelactone hydrolase family protein n=1 Tax=Asticcacaulis sp. EMRT-3 TaxID=3040349 RepID=UPI0024AF21B5|nr:dienelactone hydrolase family protein [Asticcacaulis sp. EMRT-3]MDI7775975.1 dienelactone hydrolase family protein [Asticcacaulis sp. EMRT-3]